MAHCQTKFPQNSIVFMGPYVACRHYCSTDALVATLGTFLEHRISFNKHHSCTKLLRAFLKMAIINH